MTSESPPSPFQCHILTLFPDFFTSPLSVSIVQRARKAGALEIATHDIRDQTTDRHRSADDTPYGGGAGMVMKPGPIVRSIEAVEEQVGHRLHRILLTPQGAPFTQQTAHRLAEMKQGVLMLCGRYEGVDERVREHFIDEEISIGDYILTGGEPAALVVVDALIRLRPGVLGNAASSVDESFSEGLLEYPQYTRPQSFRALEVPAILSSGDHGRIARWRREQSLRRTLRRRPDLLALRWSELDQRDQDFLAKADALAWQNFLRRFKTAAASVESDIASQPQPKNQGVDA